MTTISIIIIIYYKYYIRLYRYVKVIDISKSTIYASPNFTAHHGSAQHAASTHFSTHDDASVLVAVLFKIHFNDNTLNNELISIIVLLLSLK